MTSILTVAKEYYEQIQECLEEKPDDADTSDSIVSEFADYKETYEGFHSPIVCDVIVNGCEHKMKFSWEHFMNLAFLLESNANNINRNIFEIEKLVEVVFHQNVHLVCLAEEEWDNEKKIYINHLKNGGTYQMLEDVKTPSQEKKSISEIESLATNVFNSDKIEVV